MKRKSKKKNEKKNGCIVIAHERRNVSQIRIWPVEADKSGKKRVFRAGVLISLIGLSFFELQYINVRNQAGRRHNEYLENKQLIYRRVDIFFRIYFSGGWI